MNIFLYIASISLKHTIIMSKKQSKIKKVNKTVKPAKGAPANKKATPKNVDKNIKNKASHPSGGKTLKSAPKNVHKKVVAKKVIKPLKTAKVSATSKSAAISGKKNVKAGKPVKNKAENKTASKLLGLAEKAGKSLKNGKPEKETSKKTTALVIAVKKSSTKPVKAVKPAKPAKVAKPAKPAKAAKKEKSNKKDSAEDEDDFSFEEKVIKPAKKSKGGRKPKNKNDDDDEPIVENDILIEQLINSTKRLKKPSKVPKQLRTFTNPMASLTVAKLGDGNKKGAALPKKEPKGKFELEYVLHTSAGILYEFLTSPSGLSEWFADDVNIHDGVFTFFWEGSEQKAKLLGFKEDKFVKLQWLDKPDGTFFEFRIERDELTGDISLIVTDFADEAADLKTSKLLWDSQINQLLHVIGSY